ncbi:MAG: B12-binding domain-containing radical SAM protein [Phycisphaerae bacterium]|nr:B12-binding domain-containing radical SAM protein [Phycisphaerae bacterium]
MRIGLVSTYTHPFALGLRYVSSYLKSAGHQVVMLFMSSKRDTAKVDFSEPLLQDFVRRLRDCDLIGLSLMTNNFHRACALTQRIRAAGLSAPIVWGGTHPTVAPEECLELADVICVGEGEEPLLQLVEHLQARHNPTNIDGLWFRGRGPFGNVATVRNPPGPLQTRLDELPFPDYELETHWVADKEALVPAEPKSLRGALRTFRVVTSRGCPYHCTFCNNTALRKVYHGAKPWVRLRSIDNVLAELRQARACFPTIQTINFVDDLFLVRKEEEIEDFTAKYNEQIGLPLQLDAFPNTVTDRKVRALARVPIELISMGIESASDDTLKNIYRRPTLPRRIAEAIDILHKHRVHTEYHYIVSNPFEPDENVVETMRFIASHHKGPARLRIFPLMFYPGSPLYERARNEGLIGARDPAVYDHMGTGALQYAKHDYLAIWLRFVLNLRNIHCPSWLAQRVIDFAIHRGIRRLLDRKWFGPLVFIAYQGGRKIVRNFIYQPFIKPLKYLRSSPRRGKEYPPARWTVPAVNLAAQRRRQTLLKSAPAEGLVMPPSAAPKDVSGPVTRSGEDRAAQRS